MFEHFSHNDFTEKEKEMVVDSKNLNNLHTTYSTTLEKYKEEIYKKYSDSTEIKEKKTKKRSLNTNWVLRSIMEKKANK